MQKKCGKFLADWRDAAGARHRKAFTTRAAALAFQREMQQAVRSKKAQARRSPRRKPSAPTVTRAHGKATSR
jgi:hypothetical protein